MISFDSMKSMLDESYKHVACSTCKSRGHGLFNGISGAELDTLEAQRACNFYKKTQSLFVEGSTPRGVYCVNHGKVKVFKRGEEGKEQIIHIAKAGDLIGFRAMFSGELYKVAAESLEDSNICFIAKEDFLNMIEFNPALRNGIFKELSKELSDRADFITNMAQKSVRERLAFSLLILMDIYGEEPINLSREDLANFVGTATETLIRLLKEFKEDGCLEIEVRKLRVIDKTKLISLAGN